MGLLYPARVDGDTGYRYYSMEQVPRLHRILVLRELGFPLDQIARQLEESMSVAELRAMLRLRQAEIGQRLTGEQERLARVAARLMQMEEEGSMMMSTYDITVKQVPAMQVAAARAVVPGMEQMGQYVGILGGEAFPVAGRPPEGAALARDRSCVYELPGFPGPPRAGASPLDLRH